MRTRSTYLTTGVLLVLLSFFCHSAIAEDRSTVFVSTAAGDWTIQGRVSTEMVDGTLGFRFSFSEEYL